MANMEHPIPKSRPRKIIIQFVSPCLYSTDCISNGCLEAILTLANNLSSFTVFGISCPQLKKLQFWPIFLNFRPVVSERKKRWKYVAAEVSNEAQQRNQLVQ